MMANDARQPGFYMTATDFWYLTPAGRVWLIGSEDMGPDEPVQHQRLPRNATPADDLLTPDECIDHCRRIEAECDEVLLTDA